MLRGCGSCEKETEQAFIREPTSINVRGETIVVDIEYYKCSECGEEFIDLNSDYDHLAEAYKIYTERTGKQIGRREEV